jgi:hypothetical protein
MLEEDRDRGTSSGTADHPASLGAIDIFDRVQSHFGESLDIFLPVPIPKKHPRPFRSGQAAFIYLKLFLFSET